MNNNTQMRSILTIAALTSAAILTAQTAPRFSIGGYAEAVGKISNQTDSEARLTSAVAASYHVMPQMAIETEIGLEAAGESSVTIDQLFVTFSPQEAWGIKIGHIMLPIGTINADGDPINYFSTSCAEGEPAILPPTWNETGIELFASLGRIDCQLLVVGGLTPDNFCTEHWAAESEMGCMDFRHFKSPGMAVRLVYNHSDCFNISASHYCVVDATRNSHTPHLFRSVGRSSIGVTCVESSFQNEYVSARTNLAHGFMTNAAHVSEALGIDAIGHHALTVGIEMGINLKSVTGCCMPAICPFIRAEYYNPQERTSMSRHEAIDTRTAVASAGVNYLIGDELTLKADWTMRCAHAERDHEFGLALAYSGLFER